MARHLRVVQTQPAEYEAELEEEDVRTSPPKRPRLMAGLLGGDEGTESLTSSPLAQPPGARAIAQATQLRSAVEDFLGRAHGADDVALFDAAVQRSIVSDPRYDFCVQVLSATGRAGHIEPAFVMDTTQADHERRTLQTVLQRRSKIAELLHQISTQREVLEEAEHARVLEATSGVTERIRRLREEESKIDQDIRQLSPMITELSTLLDRFGRLVLRPGEIDWPVVTARWSNRVLEEWASLVAQRKVLSRELRQSNRLLGVINKDRATAQEGWGTDAFARTPIGRQLASDDPSLFDLPERQRIGHAIFAMVLPVLMIDVPVLSSPTWFEGAPYPSLFDDALFEHLILGSFVMALKTALTPTTQPGGRRAGGAARGGAAAAAPTAPTLALNPTFAFWSAVLMPLLRESAMVKRLAEDFSLNINDDRSLAYLFYQTDIYLPEDLRRPEEASLDEGETEEPSSSSSDASVAKRFLTSWFGSDAPKPPVRSDGRVIRRLQEQRRPLQYGVGYDADASENPIFVRLFPWLTQFPPGGSLSKDVKSEATVDALLYAQCLQQGLASLIAEGGVAAVFNLIWRAFDRLDLTAPQLAAARDVFLKELELRFAALFFGDRYFESWALAQSLKQLYQQNEVMPRFLAALLRTGDALSSDVFKIASEQERQRMVDAEAYRFEEAFIHGQALGTVIQEDLQQGRSDAPTLTDVQTGLERLSPDRVRRLGLLPRVRNIQRLFLSDVDAARLKWPDWISLSDAKTLRDQWREEGRIVIAPQQRLLEWESLVDDTVLKQLAEQVPGLDLEGAHVALLIEQLQPFLRQWSRSLGQERNALEERITRLEDRITILTRQAEADPAVEARAAGDFSALERELREENERLDTQRKSLLARANLGHFTALRGDISTAAQAAYSFIRNHRYGRWCDALNGTGGASADEQGIFVLMTTLHSRARNAFAVLTNAHMVTAEQRSGSRALYQQTRFNDLTEVEKLNVTATLVRIPPGEILAGSAEAQDLYLGLLQPPQ
jgi:hypothetical protein